MNARDERNTAIEAAIQHRAQATRDAEVEYSETLIKLNERYTEDRAAAREHYLMQVRPAHQAFVAALIDAERRYAQQCRETV